MTDLYCASSGKFRHDTRGEAWRVISERGARMRRNPRAGKVRSQMPYLCPDCKSWHARSA